MLTSITHTIALLFVSRFDDVDSASAVNKSYRDRDNNQSVLLATIHGALDSPSTKLEITSSHNSTTPEICSEISEFYLRNSSDALPTLCKKGHSETCHHAHRQAGQGSGRFVGPLIRKWN